jgi:hypothetical protein
MENCDQEEVGKMTKKMREERRHPLRQKKRALQKKRKTTTHKQASYANSRWEAQRARI